MDVGIAAGSIIFDGHCDTIMDVAEGRRTLSERCAAGCIDLPRLREGGVTAQVFAMFLEDKYLPAGAAKQTLRMIDAMYREIEANADTMTLALTAADIIQALHNGRTAAILGMEGAEGLEGDLALLRVYYRLGLRLLTVTWSRRNHAADGVSELRTGSGLTEFGVKLVDECNRLGVLLDISHLAPAGVRDVLEISRQPVVASHSNAYALCPHPRNLTDEQLHALAKTGGLVAVTFVPYFLKAGGEGACLTDVLDHIDHIVRTIGIEHVGIGSDFDGVSGGMPIGLEDATCFPALSRALLERGYSRDDVALILGGNWLRVFGQVAG